MLIKFVAIFRHVAVYGLDNRQRGDGTGTPNMNIHAQYILA